MVTYLRRWTLAQLVVPAGTLLQYSVWMAPKMCPEMLKNEVT